MRGGMVSGRSRAGVTLLELLIAVSLLSLLSAGVLMALRVGINAMGKANTRLMDNRRMSGVQRILEGQLAGFIPVVAECMPGGDRPPVEMPFFGGEQQSMRFVSAYSLGEAWRGYARILEFQVIPGENNTGVRLVVNEHLYTGARGAGQFCLGPMYDAALGLQVPRFRPIEVGPRSFVLADRLAFCRFSYREIAPPPVGERWVQRWIAPVWPTAVRIEMAPLSLDASRLQPLTITAPVRITRDPRMLYAD
jgi:prepilin-type N-terminal cleavage/methylation domain-containing protein